MSDEKKAPTPKPAPKAPITKSVLDWAREKSTPQWAFNGARCGNAWEVDPSVSPTALTEKQYDDAISLTMYGKLPEKG